LGPKETCVGNLRVSEWIKLQNTIVGDDVWMFCLSLMFSQSAVLLWLLFVSMYLLSKLGTLLLIALCTHFFLFIASQPAQVI
jgi:hypothetical protein